VDRQHRQTQCSIHYGEITFSLAIPFSDEGSVDNALTCCATLLCLNQQPALIQSRIGALQSVAMRLELKEGINHCSIINDSYSADLSSLAIALDFLTQQQQHRKRTVILSDILQSAMPAAQLYHHVAGLLRLHQVNRLIAVGPEISQHLEIFTSQHLDVQAYLTTESLLQHFDELVFSDETILVKGARSFAFENIAAQLEMQVHQTVMEIDLNAMLANLKQYQQLLGPGTRMMAMVKAFSYGSGSFEIANLLQFHGVDYLTVAYTDEGVTLRKAGIHLPIMVMNTAPNGFAALVEYNLEPVLFSLQLYRQFAGFIRQEGIAAYPVHLEMETGMNRLGFAAADLPALLELLSENLFTVQSIFSHFAASEDPLLDAYTKEQVARFMQFCDQAAARLPSPFLRHIGNTAAIFRFPEYQFDMVRLGIGLYGIDPAHAGKLHLQEVSTLKTTIAQIKHLQPGETVGYNRKGVISRPSVIATVRIGYADGYPRMLGNGRGKMKVAGKLAPVIGSICMDMTMIDITGIEGVREGDEVVVFGKGLSVSEVADWAETIPYELLTGISQRVKRIYYQD
jgi:alanine racemase